MVFLIFFLFKSFKADDLSVEYADNGETLVRGNSDLRSFEIPAKVKLLKDGTEAYNCFGHCKKTTSFTFAKDSQLERIGDFAFFGVIATSIDLTPCKKLTTLGQSSFRNAMLQEVFFPDSILEMSTYSFSNTKLKAVEIPPKLEVIDLQVFSKISTLTNVEFVDECKTKIIKIESFYYCGLTSFYIPKSVESVGSAFFKCPLTSVKIDPNNKHLVIDKGVILTSNKKTILFAVHNITLYDCPLETTIIEQHAFRNTNLETIKFNEGLKEIKNCAFWETSIQSADLPSSFTHLRNYAFACAYQLYSITFKSAPAIGSYSFQECYALTSIEIPNGTSSIGAYCFLQCTSLSRITIPSTVTEIGGGAFSGVKSDCEIIFADESPLIVEGDVLYTQYYKKLVAIFGFDTSSDRTVHWNTTIIAASAFQGQNIKRVAFYKNCSLTTIEKSAFEGCSIVSLESPSELINIQEAGFRNCKSLETFTFSDKITNIPKNCFTGCSALKSLHIPSSIETIGEYAFDGLSNLQTLTFGDKSQLNSIEFYGFRGVGASNIEVPSSIKTGTYAFTNSKAVVVTFIDDETDVEAWAYGFSGSQLLEEVYLHEHVTKIAEGAFADCPKLRIFNLPKSVISIEKYSFRNCESLTKFEIPKGSLLENIIGIAFEGCTNHVGLDVSTTHERFTWQNGCLYNKDMSNLIMYLPTNPREIFVVTNDVVKIGNYAIQGAQYLRNLTIQEGVAEIGLFGLQGCTRLEYLHLPSSLSQIGQSALADCTSLGCGSIIFNEQQKPLFDNSDVIEGALVPCPTRYFTAMATESTIVGFCAIFVGIASEEYE